MTTGTIIIFTWLAEKIISKNNFTDGVPVALNGGVGVFQLDELVSHERPGGEVVGVELEGPLEVGHCLFVLGAEGVVVTDHAAGLSPVFVDLKMKGVYISNPTKYHLLERLPYPRV